MNTTKHDLSAGTAKLNLNNLITLANAAVGFTKVQCERALNRLQYASIASDVHEMMCASADLADAATACQAACENLHYLAESKTRDEINVIKD